MLTSQVGRRAGLLLCWAVLGWALLCASAALAAPADLPPNASAPAMEEPLENVAHVIQVALTPVFLLSGIGTLLNVFNTRLARVTDHLEHASDLLRAGADGPDAARLRRHALQLRRRTFALDTAVALGALGGAATAGAAFALFVGALRDTGGALALFVLFGAAVICTIAALGAFLIETGLSWHGIKLEGPLTSLKQVPRA